MTILAKKNTYRTFSGVKDLIELDEKATTQFIIYQDDQPTYFVDLYDLSVESNSMMNSLTLCAKRSIEDALELINKRNNLNLYIPQPSKIGLKIKTDSEDVEVELEHLPEEWLDYSL